MSKRLFCVIMFAFICVSIFAGHVSSEGTYQGKHWQIWYYDYNDYRLIVDGKTILSYHYYISECTLGVKLYFEAHKSKEGLNKLYTINGDIAISHGFTLIHPFSKSREGVFEVATKKGDGFEFELYDANLKLVLPKYSYFVSVKDDDGNIKYWSFGCINGYECRLANDWKTWIGPSPAVAQQFEKIEKFISDKYYKCKKGSYWGLYDSNFKEIIAPDYEELGFFEGTNFIKFKLNGFWGVMTIQGNITKTIIPTTRGYTSIDRYIKSLKRFTYSMTGYKGECNHLGQQLSKIKVANSQASKPVAPSTISSSSSSNKTSSSSSSSTASSNSKNSSNNKTTVVVEHHRDPVPVQEWVPCGGCLGDGRCSTCGGSGRGPGSGGRCISCGYSGKCHFCNGQGGHYQTFYR